MLYDVSIDGKAHRLELQQVEGRWNCRLDGREIAVDARPISSDTLSLLIDGESFEIRRGPDSVLFVRGVPYQAVVEDPRSWRGRRGAASRAQGPQKVTASMPGKIVRVLAAEGEKIAAGQGIAVVEAMKMQNEIKSPKAGTLHKLLAKPGMNVNAGDVLAIIE